MTTHVCIFLPSILKLATHAAIVYKNTPIVRNPASSDFCRGHRAAHLPNQSLRHRQPSGAPLRRSPCVNCCRKTSVAPPSSSTDPTTAPTAPQRPTYDFCRQKRDSRHPPPGDRIPHATECAPHSLATCCRDKACRDAANASATLKSFPANAFRPNTALLSPKTRYATQCARRQNSPEVLTSLPPAPLLRCR